MRRNFAPALIACLLASLSTPTLAATAPADAIKYRKAVMEAMAAHVSAYLLINMGKVEHQDHLKAHVDLHSRENGKGHSGVFRATSRCNGE